ncbi:MAG: hypothetical protein QG657_614 [Acidobacteriota bacterium]|nr:hypothetical protein [Acidobacteriota bacterium]
MSQRPLPSFKTLWKRHESLYMDVFSMALRELSERDLLSGDENTISRTLRLILNNVCFKNFRNHEVQIPNREIPIPPKTDNELSSSDTEKRPDFTCNFLNLQAVSPEDYEISLHVECKKLGNPTSGSWNLNKNYVENGIQRFDSSLHEYGKRAPSGMMIGYIINSTPEEIETEVNRFQEKHLPGWPGIHFNFRVLTLFQTRQEITRRNVKPEQFQLIHMWVDLRNN